MNATLLLTPSVQLSQQAIELASRTVSNYLIRCGLRHHSILQEQTARIVNNALAVEQSNRGAVSEPWLDEYVTSLKTAAADPRDFQKSCLVSAAAEICGLPDRWVQTQGFSQEKAMPTKQFAIADIVELLSSHEAVDNIFAEDSRCQARSKYKACVVIPPARVRRMKQNSTPMLIGPLRIGFWWSIAVKCLSYMPTASTVARRNQTTPSSVGASRHGL